MRAGRGRAPGGFHALRRLGQNFLVDRGVLAEIVERSGVGEGDVVLEVGPGQGVLTRALLERGCLLHAVELDERLRPELEALAAASEGRLCLHWGDALRTDLAALVPFPAKVIANIPYSITTPLIWRLLALAPKGLAYCLLMVQKEAADRLLAPADTRERY
ncbi:ribosomal RNA small subunit methyltransferase A, partial [Fretibacterium fastidiosum]